ncbi:MAG: asparaginase [Bdellovibrionales bacterium]|nr:asparaginase [Bdellovibrionales bacterium]
MLAKKAKILVLYTGGTFGMDADTLSVPELSPKQLEKRLLKRVPELPQIAQCQVKIVMNRDSAHLGPPDWVAIASTIREHWDSYDGVVVLHGTDTLAYTASALSFLLRPCRVPVVLTGAQRPLAAIRSDARRNLISAVELAAFGSRQAQRPLNQVSVFFNEILFQGNRARKRSAVDFAGFESPKAPALARVGTAIQVYSAANTRLRRSTVKGARPQLDARFSSKVLMLHLTPGFPSAAVQQLLPRLEGLVLVAFPSGTAPTHQADFHELLLEAKRRQIPVMVVTEGVGITGSEYRAGKEMLMAGCLWSGAMTPECAYVKACFLLGQRNGRKDLLKWWNIELANEGASQR